MGRWDANRYAHTKLNSHADFDCYNRPYTYGISNHASCHPDFNPFWQLVSRLIGLAGACGCLAVDCATLRLRPVH